MFLIAGLGNPGKQYEMTRHNIGFEVIDYISKEYNIKVNKIKHKALIGEGMLQGEKVILAKPQTFMNLSGESIREICEYYKLSCEDVIIIYDDISLASGSIRIRAKGSAGGHNGMKSIIYQLGSDEFMRLRIGVGAPKHADYDLKDYVLGRFSKEEAQDIISAVKICPDALATMMRSGATAAASRFNRTIKEEDDGQGK
ncbi:MAG: aminoacyl-tRNA hydrolase [Ruminococcaceae bacterium]|nr:aminoacyl-tRNA hydrolase [Oscillospiraceae bacterium]